MKKARPIAGLTPQSRIMSLETYRRKRDFARTPEPSGDGDGRAGQPPPKNGRRFVVQRHRATALHYDFRLEMDGVLASWAVPRGPSLKPLERRMAVHVEDHPLDYFDFEGIIPKGEYGGGDVIVWDWGTWEPEETDDPGEAVRKGELKFRLYGQKLKGRFVLVRTRNEQGGKEQWLLMHKKDEEARDDWDVDALPFSVKSGRTNDQVKAGAPAIWNSSAPAAEAEIHLEGGRAEPLPDFVPPMLATLADKPFSDPDWLYEMKLDGYRVEAVVGGGSVKLWTRNKQDAARYFPHLAAAKPTWISASAAVVDGEVVALNEKGLPDFSLLQDLAGMKGFAASRGERSHSASESSSRTREAHGALVYHVFDLLHYEGRSLIDVPLEERKKLLKTVVREHPQVRYVSHVVEHGLEFYDAAKQQELEGIMAKLRRSRYEPGRRSRSWLKVKIRREQELVVIGYEPGKGTHKDLGSLIVAVNEDGELRYAGEVGSGIDTRTRRVLREQLDALARDTPPATGVPRLPGARWAEPRLVIRAEFSEWTTDNLLRQAAFKGMEADRDPKTVVRERAISTDEAVAAAEQKADEGHAARSGSVTPALPLMNVTKGGGGGGTRSRRSRQDAAGVRRGGGGDAPDRTPRTGPAGTEPGPQGARRGRGKAEPTNPSGGTAAGVKLIRDPSEVGNPAQAATAAELAALDAMTKDGLWEIGGHTVKLSNLDKVLFPDAGYTKRDLIRYYVTVAAVLLPHLRDRPLNVDRWPDGVDGPHFWQKQIPSHAPAWVARWDYPEAGRNESHTYVVCDRVATLAWLANQAVIDLHPWTSRLPEWYLPTYALIDIDPGEKTKWDEVVVMARLYRRALEHLGIVGFPKTTGKRGIQVWVPIAQKYTFDQTRDWVMGLSQAVGRAVPELVSWEWEKAGRRGLARLDFTQNAVNKTLVAPYAVRPVARAGVSTPIEWDELDDPDLRADRWDIKGVIPRIESVGDLFAPALELAQELPDL
jgi:bifunctional non-homologous end joining protein LigD